MSILTRIPRRRLLVVSAHAAALSSLYLSGIVTSGCLPVPDDGSLPLGIDQDLFFVALIKAYSGWHQEASEVYQGSLAVISRLRQALRDSMPTLFEDLNTAFCALEFAPVVEGYGGQLSKLAVSDQEAFIKDWSEASQGWSAAMKNEIAFGLRPLFLMALYEQPTIKTRLAIDSYQVSRNRFQRDRF